MRKLWFFLLLSGFMIMTESPSQALIDPIYENFPTIFSSSNVIAFEEVDRAISVELIAALDSAIIIIEPLVASYTGYRPFDLYVEIGGFASEENAPGRAEDAYARVDYPPFIPDPLDDLALTPVPVDVPDSLLLPGGEVCYLEIDPGFSFDAIGELEIAHEIAWCFLAFSIVDAEARLDSNTGFIIESISEYIATLASGDGSILVDRPGYDELEELVSFDEPLFDSRSAGSGYIGYAPTYFWIYLLDNGMTIDDLLEMADLTGDSGVSIETIYDYLMTNIPDAGTTFSQFAVALATDAIISAPNSFALFESIEDIEIPRDYPMQFEDIFTLDFRQFLITDDTVDAIRVSISELPEDDSVQVSVSNEERPYQALLPGDALIYCQHDSGTLLKVVGTHSNGDNFVEYTLSMEGIEDYPDCEEEDETPPAAIPGEGESESCLPGNYILVRAPIDDFLTIFDGAAESMTIEEMLFSIDGDGNISHQATGFNINMVMDDLPMTVSMNLTLSGQLDLSTGDGVTYDVETINYSMDSITASTDIMGQVMDMTPLAQEIASMGGRTSVIEPPVRLDCTEDGLNYFVTIAENETIWQYRKLEE